MGGLIFLIFVLANMELLMTIHRSTLSSFFVEYVARIEGYLEGTLSYVMLK